MSTVRTAASIITIAVGVLCLLYGQFGDITAPGTTTINLDRMHGNLVAHVWGFGLVIVGLLLRRTEPPHEPLRPLLLEQQHTNELLNRIEEAQVKQPLDRQ